MLPNVFSDKENRERKILVLFYFKGWPQTRIARTMSISRERVRQLRQRGLGRLGMDKEILAMLDLVHKRAYSIDKYGPLKYRQQEEPYELKNESDVH